MTFGDHAALRLLDCKKSKPVRPIAHTDESVPTRTENANAVEQYDGL
jgi:hypothetical protein